jgi:16S rRNA processing protein RimM
MPLRAVKARRRRPSQSRAGFRAVGRVLKPRGLHGELKVFPLTNFPERFDPGARILIAGAEHQVETSQWEADVVFIRLTAVRHRDQAEALRDALIEVPEADRASLEQNEYYLDEIEGCEVVDPDGASIGVVREVLQPGANDVYVVARQSQADLLVPAIPDVVLEVRIAQQTIVVDIPPGLDPETR